MEKRVAFLFVILTCISISAASQEVSKKPEKYQDPIEGVGLPSDNDEKSDIPWYVCSDRANNPIYSSESGDNVAYEAGFQEEFAVIKMSGNGQRLAVARINDIKNGKLDSGKSIAGWMDSEKLVLWNECLADKEFGIDKKAMILFVFDKNAKIEADNFTSDVNIYDGPGDPWINKTSKHRGLFQFFPIYKEEGNYVLLGKNSRMSSTDVEKQLVGWVNKDKLSLWSHRVAWEKNWEPNAIAEREKNIPYDDQVSGIMVLSDKTETEQYAKIDRKKNSFIPKSKLVYNEVVFNEQRKPGPMGRFPILDITDIKVGKNKLSKPVKVGVIGDLKNFKGENVDYEGIIESTDKMRSLRKINLILVVDATQSIYPYRESIKEGIEKSMTEIGKLFENMDDKDINKFRFGCVLYRDWAMKDSIQRFGTGLSTETKPLFDWLDENLTLAKNAYRPGITTDDKEEAMFYGMSYAMDFYAPNPAESNYMILIGDCGDHQDSESKRKSMFVEIEEVEDILRDYNTNLIAIQANNETHPAYDLFQQQIKQILIDYGQQPLEKISENHFELPKESLISGKLICPKKGESIPENKMASEITTSIKAINKDVNAQVRAISKALSGKGVAKDSDPFIVATVIEFFMKNAGMNNQQAEDALKGMNQEYKEGFTVMESEGYQYPYFKTVVLFEQKELQDLIEAFKDLSVAKKYPSSVQRGRLKEALDTWFPYYFSGMSMDEIRTMNVGKLLERITGLEFGKLYENITISKVTDVKQVSNAEIKKFVSDIDSKLGPLENIYKRRERYEARVVNAEVDDLFLYVPGYLFKSNN